MPGWLLSPESGEEPDKWHVVCLPAIYEDHSGLSTELKRRTGFHERRAAKRYARNATGNRNSSNFAPGLAITILTHFQQQPTSKKGLFFDVSRLEIVEARPEAVTARFRGWDKAATAGDGDFTAGVRVSKDKEDIYFVEDVVRGQWDTATRDRNIKQTAETDGKKVKIRGEQEPGSGGVFQAQAFIKMLAGFSVKW